MISQFGHGSDAVVIPRNEKARWAGTHRAVFVALSSRPAGSASYGRDQQTGDISERGIRPANRSLTDGIGILSRRP
jgi:hypothetical protein